MPEIQTGPHGKAEPIQVPDMPEAAETLCQWLITSPPWHPLWTQYLLFVVRLRDDVPGFPPPSRQFEGATHEMMLFALNPGEEGNALHTPESLHQACLDKSIGKHFLTPVNIAQQHEATDEEMERVAELSAWAVIHGLMNPETADAPTRTRENWLASATKSLAHMRGEEHAS